MDRLDCQRDRICRALLLDGEERRQPGAGLQPDRSSGDPEVFQKELFRTAFNGFGLDEATVRGNIRHEVFGAVLVAMYVASWAVHFRPLVTRAQR